MNRRCFRFQARAERSLVGCRSQHVRIQTYPDTNLFLECPVNTPLSEQRRRPASSAMVSTDKKERKTEGRRLPPVKTFPLPTPGSVRARCGSRISSSPRDGVASQPLQAAGPQQWSPKKETGPLGESGACLTLERNLSTAGASGLRFVRRLGKATKELRGVAHFRTCICAGLRTVYKLRHGVRIMSSLFRARGRGKKKDV